MTTKKVLNGRQMKEKGYTVSNVEFYIKYQLNMRPK